MRAQVAVIGLGPGGEYLAGELAENGVDVVGIDRALVGGECPYFGCVPTKMMIRAANLIAEARRIDGVAGTATVAPDWGDVARRIRTEATDDWNDHVAVDRLAKKGARFVRGNARIEGPHTLTVDGETVEADKIVIAAGTMPAVPPIRGLSDVPYWTNHEAIQAKELPASIAILGGGAIGLELGQVFARFDTRVTIIEGAPRLAPPEEPEASALIEEIFAREGIDVRTGAKVLELQPGPEIGLENGDTVRADQVLVATGRKTDLPGLGVGSIGIDESARFIKVDGRCRAAEDVWALGDITGEGAFTHISMHQARIVADDILGRTVVEGDYRALPRVTFTDPEIGSVGITEEHARKAGIKVRTGSTKVQSSARGWIHKTGNEGIIKLVMDADAGVLVGATSMGPVGGEVLSMLTLAVHARIPVGTLRSMIYAYPTFHRGVEDALRDLLSV
jgi:pyruvate/2-oxoglutarate dehydrogenase complex dihydrolipoamide dehydrogenase (E3) component